MDSIGVIFDSAFFSFSYKYISSIFSSTILLSIDRSLLLLLLLLVLFIYMMEFQIVSACICIIIVLSSSIRVLEAVVPNSVYMFGDSLADVGNNNYLHLSYLKADFPHNGVDFLGKKATGRFSNGKNSADFLAENLGIPTSPPYLSIPADSNQTQTFLSGVSFASGGAGILDSTNSGLCLPLNKQIQYFSTVYANLVQQFGSKQVQVHLSKSIFGLIIGSNDILNYIEKKESGEQQQNIIPQLLVASMLTSLRVQLKALYNFGARKFAFTGSGLVGCCPARRNKLTGACNDEGNSISFQFDTAAAALLQDMKSEFSDMNYSFFNSSAQLSDIIQNPATYGYTEVKAACCGLGYLNAKIACLPISSLCPDRSSHLFWDFFHPSERTAELLTTTFFQGSPPHVYPVNVKQLTTL